MDGTRVDDINHLTMVLHNPDETALHKRQAFKALERIKRKMKDPHIKTLRERLIKAQRANDVAEVEKLSNQLHDYEKRTYGQN